MTIVINHMTRAIFLLISSSIFALSPISLAYADEVKQSSVLVIMSYDDKNNSEREIAQGIENALTGQRIHYYYLDAKNHPDLAAGNAQNAYTRYQELKPDVVIAADDAAQKLFVLPYLLGKTPTPVVFCGVNDSASQYGYPNTQTTGIIEKKHYRQSIGLAQLIDPRIKKIAIIYRDTPTNATNLAQLKREEKDYGITITSFTAVNSSSELLATLKNLEEENDALLVLNLAGINDDSGNKMEQSAAMALTARTWNKPSIGASKNEIEDGILCGVAKINLEQGLVAGTMAQNIIQGKSPADIPVTENQNGQRMINATTAYRLGLKLKPMVLIGTTLVQ